MLIPVITKPARMPPPKNISKGENEKPNDHPFPERPFTSSQFIPLPKFISNNIVNIAQLLCLSLLRSKMKGSIVEKNDIIQKAHQYGPVARCCDTGLFTRQTIK